MPSGVAAFLLQLLKIGVEGGVARAVIESEICGQSGKLAVQALVKGHQLGLLHTRGGEDLAIVYRAVKEALGFFGFSLASPEVRARRGLKEDK